MTAAIDALSSQLQQSSKKILSLYTQTTRPHEIWGWHFPPLNKQEMARILTTLSDTLQANKTLIDLAKYDDEIKSLTNIVSLLDSQIITNMFGNPVQGFPAFFATTQYLEERISHIAQWQMVKGTKTMPPALLRRLQDIQADIESMAPDKAALKKQIDLIASATATAEELPTTLQRLKQTSEKIALFLAESTENNGRITDNTAKAKEQIDTIIAFAAEAKALIAQCEEAYRTTTTRGLAAAFDERATSLKVSMRWWVLLLALSLIAGAGIGYIRVEQLTSALNASAPDWGVIWAKGILSVLSIGAPLWLAWLSTKQIGQRFRLAEDYGFKASVAKAYEGYRREAAKIDDAFVSRLFGSALTRLEEAPLRFVEQEAHSSPWEELRKSAEFKEALEKAPAFVERVAGVFKAKLPAAAKAEAPALPKPTEGGA